MGETRLCFWWLLYHINLLQDSNVIKGGATPGIQGFMDLLYHFMKWIIDKYYYIINFRYFLRPRIYPVYFVNKRAAKRAIQLQEPSRKYQGYYEIIRGNKLKAFKSTYVLRLGRLGKFTRYPYPKELITIQQRKSYRTLMRRRLRRMGMLTNVRSKYRVEDKPGIIKVKLNNQWIANTPYTTCICFALERKPNRHYIIIKKRLSLKKGKLFRLKVLEFTPGKETVPTKYMYINRKDIIIPYLITNLIEIYGKKFVMARTRESQIKLNHPKQKAVLSLHERKLE